MLTREDEEANGISMSAHSRGLLDINVRVGPPDIPEMQAMKPLLTFKN